MSSEETWRIVPFVERHLSRVAEIHREAFDGYPHLDLGDKYLRRMLRWYATDRRAIAFVAELPSDGPIGYVFGADPDGMAACGRQLLLPAACSVIRRPWLLTRARFRDALARRLATRPPREPARSSSGFSLVAIGVASEVRQRGVGSSLMDAFRTEARERGARNVWLSVHASNAAARALYERAGWRSDPAMAQNAVLTYASSTDLASRTAGPPRTGSDAE